MKKAQEHPMPSAPPEEPSSAPSAIPFQQPLYPTVMGPPPAPIGPTASQSASVPTLGTTAVTDAHAHSSSSMADGDRRRKVEIEVEVDGAQSPAWNAVASVVNSVFADGWSALPGALMRAFVPNPTAGTTTSSTTTGGATVTSSSTVTTNTSTSTYPNTGQPTVIPPPLLPTSRPTVPASTGLLYPSLD